MLFDHTVAVLGGDTRQLFLVKHLAAAQLPLRVFGLPSESLPEQVEVFSDFKQALAGAATVILPLPASPDGVHVNMPLAGGVENPRFEELFSLVGERALLAGGRFSPALKQRAGELGVRLFDYFESEELQQKNALPTAEGAVSILMREVPQTVRGLKVGVTGFGRVARALVDLLLAMGAKVCVAARKSRDLAMAREKGCETVQIVDGDSLLALVRKTGVIFNTVPHWIFSARILSDMSRESLIIDLASAPGGVDAAVATAHGIRVIWALSLPGKYAPATAGEIIADTVLSKIREEDTL